MQQMEIRQLIQHAGLVVTNMISKHELDSLLFEVQFELDKLKVYIEYHFFVKTTEDFLSLLDKRIVFIKNRNL